MKDVSLYPLRFEPIFKTALWGGNKLRPMLRAKPVPEPTGEAWVLSDVADSLSRVAEGPLRGATLHDLMRDAPVRLLGRAPEPHGRFPLLLKFLDARQPLSVQVHPNDIQAKQLTPDGLGKTEAWVILESEPDSPIYAGLRKGITRNDLVTALRRQTVEQTLHAFHPNAGDCVYLRAGTVHAIGAGLLLFEVQQTSDITYRLYDWGRSDAKTGRPRELHVEQSLFCIDFERGPVDPVLPQVERTEPARCERLVECEYFTLHRWIAKSSFPVGAEGQCRMLAGMHGSAAVQHGGRMYPIHRGEVLLLPAEIGACECIPEGMATLLECGLPDRPNAERRVG